MKTLLLAASSFVLLLLPFTQAQNELGETQEQRDARMGWWREAKFGMFIHWGLYAVPAGYYHDKPVGGIGEWIMNRGKTPRAEYQGFAKEFNPVKFNAEQWAETAKKAGMNYIVITAKHHDGFTMFCFRGFFARVARIDEGQPTPSFVWWLPSSSARIQYLSFDRK